MKWKNKPWPRHPNHGERRERAVFALLSRQCEDGYTRWLEWVWVTEEWVSGFWAAGCAGYWDEVKCQGIIQGIAL